MCVWGSKHARNTHTQTKHIRFTTTVRFESSCSAFKRVHGDGSGSEMRLFSLPLRHRGFILVFTAVSSQQMAKTRATEALNGTAPTAAGCQRVQGDSRRPWAANPPISGASGSAYTPHVCIQGRPRKHGRQRRQNSKVRVWRAKGPLTSRFGKLCGSVDVFGMFWC